jgi:hypothetical protein
MTPWRNATCRTLVGVLRDRNLLDSLFVLGFLLVLATIARQGLKRHPGKPEIVVALGVTAVYLTAFARMAIPEERTHLVEYGVVGIFICEALTERLNQGRRVPAPALLALLGTALLGLLDEGIQALLPSRVFDPIDILVDVLAGIMAVGASLALGWARRRASTTGNPDWRRPSYRHLYHMNLMAGEFAWGSRRTQDTTTPMPLFACCCWLVVWLGEEDCHE